MQRFQTKGQECQLKDLQTFTGAAHASNQQIRVLTSFFSLIQFQSSHKRDICNPAN